MRKPRLTLVIPCYNEERRLDVPTLLRFVQEQPRIDLLLVDDGSRDATPRIIERMSKESSRVSVLTFPNNQGKAQAVRAGLLRAIMVGSPFVGYWDADLATPLEEAPRMLDLLERQEELDLVLGSRVKLLGRNIHRRTLRHYIGRVFATAASLALRLPVYDTQCGAKVLRVTLCLREALSRPFDTGWLFDVELLARLKVERRRAGLDPDLSRAAWEMPVLSWHDAPGSKVRWWHGLRAAVSLLGIACRYRI